jgi:hypothetical protein
MLQNALLHAHSRILLDLVRCAQSCRIYDQPPALTLSGSGPKTVKVRVNMQILSVAPSLMIFAATAVLTIESWGISAPYGRYSRSVLP